jgi:hypothetical protein
VHRFVERGAVTVRHREAGEAFGSSAGVYERCIFNVHGRFIAPSAKVDSDGGRLEPIRLTGGPQRA